MIQAGDIQKFITNDQKLDEKSLVQISEKLFRLNHEEDLLELRNRMNSNEEIEVNQRHINRPALKC